MTTAIRYKFVKGLAATTPYTIDTFPSMNDGDDKQVKVIRRVITAADVGTAMGQLGYEGDATHTGGMIAAVIPVGQTVLSIECNLLRPNPTAVNGMIRYSNMDNKVVNPVAGAGQVSIYFGLATDNTIRVIDTDPAGIPVAAKDVVILRLILGPREDTADDINTI